MRVRYRFGALAVVATVYTACFFTPEEYGAQAPVGSTTTTGMGGAGGATSSTGTAGAGGATSSTGTAGAGGVCGDGNVDASLGERCDGSDLNGAECTSIEQGYVGGTLACRGDCLGYDITGCDAPLNCGNGRIDSRDEDCDGDDLDGANCVTILGPANAMGTLTCTGGCKFEASQCVACGNGTREPNEVCDGNSLNGQSCDTQGFHTGTLVCDTNCQLDVTGCTNCGNGNIDPPEICDGNNLDGQNCKKIGFNVGELECNGSCTALVTTGCYACKDANDCGTNETCTDTNQCACNMKTSSTGKVCNNAYPCTWQLSACNCSQGSCTHGFVCNDGSHCICDSNDDCDTGTCTNGLCICAGMTCSEGQTCEGNLCSCDNGSCPPGPA